MLKGLALKGTPPGRTAWHAARLFNIAWASISEALYGWTVLAANEVLEETYALVKHKLITK